MATDAFGTAISLGDKVLVGGDIRKAQSGSRSTVLIGDTPHLVDDADLVAHASIYTYRADPGNTPDDTKAIAVVNSTAAILNVSGDDGQSYSPSMRLEGQGYDTGATASVSAEFRSYVIPVQGNPITASLVFESSIGGAAYVEHLRLDNNLVTIAGSVVESGAHIGNAFAGVWTGGTAYAAFSHWGLKSTSGSYGLLQQSEGTTYLNAATGKTIHHRVNNATVMQLDVNGLGFGGATTAAAAIRITSTTQGLGMPGMTTTQRNAIGSPFDGLTVWNSTTGTTDVYDAFLGAWAASV
jgi:hypothetical protein